MTARTKYLVLALLAALWLNLGPRPADNSHYQASDYYREARRSLELARPESASGPLTIGLAEADISPPLGHPLAGFGGRRPKANTGQDSPCLARALSLEVNGLTTSILTADILLMDESLVAEVLRLSGLGPEEVYFTASHSHSCAGGYAKGVLMEQILGDYDPAWTKRLAQQLAQLLTTSRRDLVPADLAWVNLEVPNSQQNRIDHQAPTNDRLSLLLFRKHNSMDPPLAIFTVFGAHATLFSLKSHLVSADYPGYFLQELKARTQARHLLFAAGSVGDARPAGPAILGKDAKVNAQSYGRYLAEAAASALENLNWSHEIRLGRLNLALQLPEVRLPLGPTWTLGPLLTRLLPDRQTVLHGLRLNDLVLLGFPVDYSGHLFTALAACRTWIVESENRPQPPVFKLQFLPDLQPNSPAIRQKYGEKCAAAVGLQPTTSKSDRLLDAQLKNQANLITTSFSGGYKGYLVASNWFFGFSDYETRTVNFFGPWAGDYLNEMAARLARRLMKE